MDSIKSDKINLVFTKKEIAYLENALIYFCSQHNSKSDCQLLKSFHYGENQIKAINDLHNRIYRICEDNCCSHHKWEDGSK